MAGKEKAAAVEDRLVSVTYTVARLGISRTTVYSLMDSGAFAYAKIGKSRRISMRVLEEFIQRSMVVADR